VAGDQTTVDIPVQPAPWSAEQQAWVEHAWSYIDADRLAQIDLALARIPSPTGEERTIAQFIVDHLRGVGVEAIYQPIDERQANAVGRLRGLGDGPDLLLYAPTDTALTGREDEDMPWRGSTERPDLQTDAYLKDGLVVGLGAENPKGYVCCILAAAEVVHRAGIPLRGDVLLGLGAGGMPTNRPPGIQRFNAGQGNGCSFMLEQGVRADFAIIAKPGYAAAWEEVGLCWFKIIVKGTFQYAGNRHLTRYVNPILESAKVMAGLEEWFPEYTRRNTSGLVAPQGSIGAIEGGWTYKPTFVPAECHLYVDLRISPRTTPMDAKGQFGEAMQRIGEQHPDLDVSWDMILSIPGGHTDPRTWIVQSAMRAWELIEGRPHAPILNTSGATDAAILRGRGIPTVRLGMPRPPSPFGYPFSMGVCSVDGMVQLTRALVYAIVDTCTRDRAATGLPG
jgi:acetylornithine deacetylase/succinyl-diaminopimelate desuccinylase-like protein